MVSQLKRNRNEPISHDSLMEEVREGAVEALRILRSIAGDFDCEPRDRITACTKQIDAYVRLASLVEIDSIESLPVLKAINGSRK